MPGVIDATVVICAYTEDRWADLLNAVTSVQAQRPAPKELLIVVDHNDVLLPRAAEIPGVRAIASTGARGLSGARNTGISEAGSSMVVFLDDDAVAEPGWLEGLCKPLSDGVAEVVGGRADADFPEGRPAWFPEEFDWVVGCTYRGHPEGRVPIRNPIGCSMAFQADALAAAGPFREGIGRTASRPLGCEETELCIRLVQRVPGTRIIFEPSSVVRQRVPAARATFRYFLARCYAEGLSKAEVARSVGRGPALRSERTYVSRTLPAAVVRGVLDVRHGRFAGIARAGATVAGLVTTAAGYLRGRLPGATSEGGVR